jgi:cation:H+ antiporter
LAEARASDRLRGLNSVVQWMESTGNAAPWWLAGLFLGSSWLMIWRLEAMSKGKDGVEGTVLGALVMPYCSGLGNLIFAFVVGRQGGSGTDVLTNALVNNVTNMTVFIALPLLMWGMKSAPTAARPAKRKKTKGPDERIHRLSILFTLTAGLFFTGAVWALGRDGKLNAADGLVLVGLFLFWQAFHVYEVLKSNLSQNKSFNWMLPINLAILAIGAYGIYESTDWLVAWVSSKSSGFVSAKHLGWLSGWLMAVPNGLLAFYYARRGNPEVVYASQAGDGHISIPLCIGIFALFRTISVPSGFNSGVLLLAIATATHFLFIGLLGKLPRLVALGLLALYALFVATGLGNG